MYIPFHFFQSYVGVLLAESCDLLNCVCKCSYSARPIILSLLNRPQDTFYCFGQRIMSSCWHIYIKLSNLFANCRHSSVACERIDVFDSPTTHSERNVWSTGGAVLLQIKKRKSFLFSESFQHNLCSLYILCISKAVKYSQVVVANHQF